MYTKRKPDWVKHLDFLLIDIVLFQLSLAAAYFFRHGSIDLYDNDRYFLLAVLLMVVSFVFGIMGDPYKNILKRGYYKEFTATLYYACMVTMFLIIGLFLVKYAADYSRIVVVLTLLIFIVISYPIHNLRKSYLRRVISRKDGKRRLFIISDRASIMETIENIQANNYARYKICGAIIRDAEMHGRIPDGIRVVPDVAGMMKYLAREAVDEVVVALEDNAPVAPQLLNQIIDMGIVVHSRVAQQDSVKGRKYLVERIGTMSLLTTSLNFMTVQQMAVKRIMDILGGLVGCLVTLPLIIIITPMIMIKDPGPIVYRQERVGRNGRRFKIVKFRTMYRDADERKAELQRANKFSDGLMFKIKADPRVIGANEKGKGFFYFIREHSLDEFPQFFNVLIGDMSLVGTRPPTLDEWRRYDFEHRGRMAIKPGVTGLWQISDRDKIKNFSEVVKLDKTYIYNEWSLGGDIGIILKTVLVMLKK